MVGCFFGGGESRIYYLYIYVLNIFSWFMTKNRWQGAISVCFFYRYKIRDLSGQGQYLVDLKLSVCFSDGAPCQMEVIIVSNYLVTKPACAWFNGYKIAGECGNKSSGLTNFLRISNLVVMIKYCFSLNASNVLETIVCF